MGKNKKKASKQSNQQIQPKIADESAPKLASDTRFPTIKWAQRSGHVTLTVEQPDTENIQISVDDQKNSIFFSAQSKQDGQIYGFDLELFDKVVKSECTWNTKGRNVVINVAKADKEQEEWWPRVTKEKVRNQKIVIDWSLWIDQDEENEEEQQEQDHQMHEHDDGHGHGHGGEQDDHGHGHGHGHGDEQDGPGPDEDSDDVYDDEEEKENIAHNMQSKTSLKEDLKSVEKENNIEQIIHGKIFELNVRGNLDFKVSEGTLANVKGSSLQELFLNDELHVLDDEGRIQIDRDPLMFGLIIQYLENNLMPVDIKDEKMRKKFIQELKFWDIKPKSKQEQDLCKLRIQQNAKPTIEDNRDSWGN